MKEKRKIKLMKNRFTIFTTSLSVLACFAFLPHMQAAPQVAPPPDGCYPGFTTAEGCNALQHLGAGAGNTGVGWYSLFFAGDANYNTGVGAGTLVLTTTGADSNTAVGTAAMLLNTTGYENVAVGTNALVYNDSGFRNTAVGAFSLTNNIDGSFNTALGRCSLSGNIHASNNAAMGFLALFSNDSSGNGTAAFNTAVGTNALMNNIDGDYITALGANAGTDSGIVRNNIYIGDAGASGDENVIAIGAIAASGTDYTDTFIGGIYGASVNVGTAAAVYVDTDGHLGTVLVGASGKPAAPRVRRGKAAQPQAMLNRKVEKLQVTTAQQQKQIGQQQKQISQQQKQIEVLVAQLKEQAAQIQKVSAQLEASKPAPQVVNNP